MPRPTRLALGALLLGCTLALPAMRAAETQTAHTFERTISKTVAYKYLVALPTGYASDTTKRWPVLLFLHGSGERGSEVWAVTKHGPAKLVHEPAESPAAKLLTENFIVVSPQCPSGTWWDTDGLLGLLDEVIAAQRVDTTRVYLTGLSMGGYGAWDLGLAYPERFAALVPVCGGGNYRTVVASRANKLAELRSLPV
ncbi:MAG: PHB depolymerase family esterase, partial [Verrucomicrobiota bacterium]